MIAICGGFGLDLREHVGARCDREAARDLIIDNLHVSFGGHADAARPVPLIGASTTW